MEKEFYFKSYDDTILFFEELAKQETEKDNGYIVDVLSVFGRKDEMYVWGDYFTCKKVIPIDIRPYATKEEAVREFNRAYNIGQLYVIKNR